MSFAEELSKCLHAIGMIGHAARLTTAVHSKDGIAHVDATDRDGLGKDIAKGAAACHVRVVDETLTGHTALTTYLRKR